MTEEESIACLLRAELDEISDASMHDQINRLLIAPRLEHRNWDYGSEGQTFPCWFVLEHQASNTGIVYCPEGFGPRCPWGLMFLTGKHLSMGPDASWYPELGAAFLESMAYNADAESGPRE
jgi:hypothetical protein